MSDSGSAVPGSEPRPRPQFGEYATPEEQQARIRQPDVQQKLDGVPVATDEPVAPVAAPAPTQPVAPDTRAAAALQRPRSIDRIVTFGLLAYGLVNVFTSFPALVDYVAYVDRMFELVGVDATLSDPAGARPWGIAAALVLAFGWALTATLSWISVRRGRISWWIPLVGGIVFTFASAILILVPLSNDPAVWDALVGSIT